MTELKLHLSTRRSVAIPALKAPAPSGSELDTILELAVRVPDHGKLAPWRLILIDGDPAQRLGQRLADLAQVREDAPLSDARRAYEETRFTRAPLVVCVVSSARPHFKIPEWEQVLSVGALTMNLIHAFNAHGYGTNWITEWPTYDEDAKVILGVALEEKIAGFVYVGTPESTMSERPRPPLSDVVSRATS